MNTIHYAQCWEDPRILTGTLKISPSDNVISIASAGDNTFALLLEKPASLTAVDLNPVQIDLVELKIRAMQILEYDDFISFVGARPCADRIKLYNALREHLSERSRGFWDSQSEKISKGIIHGGKFETYFEIFRRRVLPLIHSQKCVRKLLSLSTPEGQQKFYPEVWNNRRWQLLFRIFFGKFILGYLGRDPSFFRYVDIEKIAEELLTRSRRGLTEIPIHDNFFLEYILTGGFSDLENVHPYLVLSNFEYLKVHAGEIHLVTASLWDYLKTLPSKSISKFNLSDIFEYMSPTEYEAICKELTRTGRDEASIAFWTLFIPRFIPQGLLKNIISDTQLLDEIKCQDRGFFYGGFNLWRLGTKNKVKV